MIHFLIGFYFGGALATFLGIVGTSIVSDETRSVMTDSPIATLMFLVFWPIALIRAILLAIIG